LKGSLAGRRNDIVAALNAAGVGTSIYYPQPVPRMQYYRQKYFAPAGDQLQVQQPVRDLVTFSRLNLSDDSRMIFMKSLDVIFCCNVLIYFDLASKRRVIQHFYNNLLPHGYLFLGHSESLYGVADDFRLVHLPGATAYLRGERSAAGKKAL